MTESSTRIHPFPSGFGAWADHDVTRPLSAADVQEITDAFHKHLFVLFRGADLSIPQLATFIDAFGTHDTPTGRLATAVNGYAGIRVVENVERSKFGPRSNSELHWHSDRFYDPVVAGLLCSVVVPEIGGDTSLVDMCRAYDELPDDLRKAIEGRTIRQDCLFGEDGQPRMRPGGVRVDDVVTSVGIETPIVQVRRHTWRKYLYLGNRLNSYIPSLSLAESEALLDRLFEHIDQPHLQYRHHWSPHQLMFYDNRCCMHRRESFDADAQRKLYASVVADSLIL
jgi:alpha-ketoglutarate-dependent taurine dioxygenase